MFDLVSPESVGLHSPQLDRISDWMRRQIERDWLPGMSVLIHRRGETAFFDAAGLMDVEAGKPLAADTIFRIYSMTKPVTSVAVMMLYEEGRFQLDDPLAKFLPVFANMQVLTGGDAAKPELEPARELITIRHLLTHTAGLTYHFMMDSPVDALYRDHGIQFTSGDASLATVVDRLAALPLLAHPGSAWNYSVATDVLGRLVEVISGLPFDRFLEERIFKPLGMVDTAFSVPADKLDRFAALYAPAPGTAIQVPRTGPKPGVIYAEPQGGLQLMDPPKGGFARPCALPGGGGGLTSTMADYLRFCRMLLNKGELDGVRLLGRKTVEFMTMNHLPGTLADMGQPRFFNEADGAGMGFGLGFSVVLNPARAQTQGSTGEYFWHGMANTQFWIDPAEELIVIQMAQLMPTSVLPLRRQLRSLVYPALLD